MTLGIETKKRGCVKRRVKVEDDKERNLGSREVCKGGGCVGNGGG